MSAAIASVPRDAAPQAEDRAARVDRLGHVIDHAAHLLPAQGPITVFIHHNTLHAFEDLPFDEAVQRGGKIFGCNPYLPKDRYRDALARGRIREADFEATLREDLGGRADEPILTLATRYDLRAAMLRYPIRSGPTRELQWFIAETDALNRTRPDVPPAVRDRLLADTRRWVTGAIESGNRDSTDSTHSPRPLLAGLFAQFGEPSGERWSDATWDAFTLQALWKVCREGVRSLRTATDSAAPVRHRDLLLEATGEDSDRLVNEILIPLCAAFLDQGFSRWPLPERNHGIFRAFCTLYGSSGGPPAKWLCGLRREVERVADLTPAECLLDSLERLGVAEPEWETFLSQTLLALRGWAGMIAQVEERGDRVAHPIPQGSLVGYLAVRLILERLALAAVAAEALGYDGPLVGLRTAAADRVPRHRGPGVNQRAFQVFQLAQLIGWSPEVLHRLTKHEWAVLVDEIEQFSNVERRRVFHAAYERRYVRQTLDAIAVHARGGKRPVRSPRFQAIFCIDDREESFRRHLEEICPDAETFAVAGFFDTPIYFKGAADAHFIPLCPIVMRPQHWVTEEVAPTLADEHRRRSAFRRVFGTLAHRLHLGSRTFAGGTFLSVGTGVFASVPLVGRILFPRLAARVRRRFGSFIEPPPLTQLTVERRGPTPGPEPGGLGFSLDEMANCGEKMLRNLGLTSGFGRLVLVIGHGSTSLNNPHMSAYGCGACSGATGGPNARAVSQMLNDPRVRSILAARGLPLPDDTVFVGALHNTCDDHVTFFDPDRVPASHRDEFDAVRGIIERTCERNAHERCRRFMSAPLTLSYEDAKRHVEARSEDLAQPRPELGHVTNAVCFVGRRSRTRGLFMDRRAFLNSYDPTQDDAENSILARLLLAAVPVCAGISLEYLFSHIDSPGYGCGTKLPHNVSALLGVMDGAASDLRTGLPWQMVEIHEPVRILFVIETDPDVMLLLMEKHALIGRHCRNGWIQLATLDPDSDEIHVFRDGRFRRYEPEVDQLPTARSSVDWYGGRRDHLEYARIEPPPAET